MRSVFTFRGGKIPRCLSLPLKHACARSRRCYQTNAELTADSEHRQNLIPLTKPVRAQQYHPTVSGLKDRLWQCVSRREQEIDELLTNYESVVIGKIDVNTMYGGMRDMPGLLCETSLVDGEAGLILQGMTIDQCRKKLPAFNTPGGEPMAEGALWLLCTGEIPTKAEAESLQAELSERAVIPETFHRCLNSLPRTMHPMTQLTIALMLMGSESETAKLFAGNNLSVHSESMHVESWHLFYEDCMNLIARLPILCAFIYHRTYGNSPLHASAAVAVDRENLLASPESGSDWCGTFINLLGLSGDPDFSEFFRLSTLCHCDHENGSVYAHTNHIISSALTDPYRAYAGALNGLAGPLHGLANQHALLLYKSLVATLDNENRKHGILEEAVYDDLLVENCVRKYLAQGRVMPGYGHAVLRSHDPRYLAMREFASNRNLAQRNKLIRFERQLSNIVPRLLMEKPKIKNPWPNIDANSGVMLNYFGIPFHSFYTVFFALSGSLGPMASTLWSRGLRLPMEQPDSLSTNAAMNLCGFYAEEKILRPLRPSSSLSV